MKQSWSKYTSLIVCILLLAWGQKTLATNICLDPLCGGIYGYLNNTGLGEADPIVVASQLINVFLQILGILCLLLMLYGGWKWIWARGNEDEITTAKDIIRGTIIGLIVILSSYGILQWLFYYVTKITNAI